MEDHNKWETQGLLVLSKLEEFKRDIENIKEDNIKTKIALVRLDDKLTYIVLIASSVVSFLWQFGLPLILGK